MCKILNPKHQILNKPECLKFKTFLNIWVQNFEIVQDLDISIWYFISMKVKCPICKKETEWEENEFRPFCSERCKLIDLGKWASEEYRIAGKKDEEDKKKEEE